MGRFGERAKDIGSIFMDLGSGQYLAFTADIDLETKMSTRTNRVQ